MRGGRKRLESGAKTGLVASVGISVITVSVGIRSGLLFGSPWNPQQAQIPLQGSGATGWECLTV